MTTPTSTTTERQLSTTVLVIGTGGSGLRAAIELAEAGVDVLALGKRQKSDAHTSLAAGGINAALATMDPDDSWQQHAADTLKESYLLADPRTVETVTKGAGRGIQDLERYGMPFAREADGRISQRFFGAHTYRRTAFAGDYTGLEIQRTLVNRAAQLEVPILDTVYVTRILVNDDGAVFGAFHAAHPGIELHLSENGSRRLLEELGAGELDLALVTTSRGDAADRFIVAPLLVEELVLISAAGAPPVTDRDTLPLAAVAGLPQIVFSATYDLRATTDAAFDNAG
ncbi:MAG TPA: FAD-binding protein, partial [Agromyces sp.]